MPKAYPESVFAVTLWPWPGGEHPMARGIAKDFGISESCLHHWRKTGI